MSLIVHDLDGNKIHVTGKQVFFSFSDNSADCGISINTLSKLLKSHLNNGKEFTANMPTASQK